jgi:ankyrin repeat protein
VRLLVKQGCDAKATNSYFGLALAAAFRGHKGVMECLLCSGADPNAQAGKLENVLRVATTGGGCTVVRLLIDAGVDFNAQGSEYNTAICSGLVWLSPSCSSTYSQGVDANKDKEDGCPLIAPL